MTVYQYAFESITLDEVFVFTSAEATEAVNEITEADLLLKNAAQLCEAIWAPRRISAPTWDRANFSPYALFEDGGVYKIHAKLQFVDEQHMVCFVPKGGTAMGRTVSIVVGLECSSDNDDPNSAVANLEKVFDQVEVNLRLMAEQINVYNAQLKEQIRLDIEKRLCVAETI